MFMRQALVISLAINVQSSSATAADLAAGAARVGARRPYKHLWIIYEDEYGIMFLFLIRVVGVST